MRLVTPPLVVVVVTIFSLVIAVCASIVLGKQDNSDSIDALETDSKSTLALKVLCTALVIHHVRRAALP